VNEYEGIKRVVYGEGATFVPVCEKCGKFVKPDKFLKWSESTGVVEPNAMCKKCGRTSMIFEGWI